MEKQPDHEERARLEQRVRQLRNQLDEISGGKARFGANGEGLPLEAEIQFLEYLIAFETAGKTTWRRRLSEAGYVLPEPATLSEEAIGLEVWQLIQRLAEMRVFLYHTNHLSDRALYERLFYDVLARPIVDFDPGEDSACHIDLLGSGSEEDSELWLRYFATEEERRQWRRRYPSDPLPPREAPPHDRDRLLPSRSVSGHPMQRILRELMKSDWNDPRGALYVNTTLTADDVAGAGLYLASRLLLERLRAAGKVKATSSRGNLPRALVRALLPLLPLPLLRREVYERHYRVMNEEDIPLLHQVRVACEAAQLLRKQGGYFRLTRRGAALLDPARAGELYGALFTAFFRRLSLAYFDRLPEYPGIQDTLPILLWRLKDTANDWTSLENLCKATLVPGLWKEIAADEDRWHGGRGLTLDARVWRHLAYFGLLESQPAEPSPLAAMPKAYRITPLFKKALKFNASLLSL